MELGLAAQRPANRAILPDDRILFLGGPHALTSPLRHGRRRLELDREPGPGDHLVVAATLDTLLSVPPPDERAGAVPVDANGVRIDGSVDAGATHLRQRGGENLIAGAPDAQL